MKEASGIAAISSKLRRELLKGVSKNLCVTRAPARFEGMRLTVPLLYGLGADHLSRGEQPWTYRLLAGLLERRPGALVDIGANVGLYLIWLKSLDESRAYIGFEPNPACCFYIQELIRSNQFADAAVFPVALSDSRSRRSFFARRLGDKMGSLLADHRSEREKPFSFDVLTEPGDAVFATLDLPAISAMKVDVEGFELEVLRGLADTLKTHRPPVICEVLTPDPARPEYEARLNKIEELLALTRGLDYQLLSLEADGQLQAAESPEALRKDAQPDRVLIPREDLDSILRLWQSCPAP